MIAPGESIQFDASLAASIATGPRKSTVKVIVEGFSKPIEVDVRAEVVVALRAIPPAINVLPNVPVVGRVVIESIDRKPFRILSVDNRAPIFVGFDPAKDAAKSTYLVRYDFGQYATDALPAWCLIQTDRTDSPVLAIKMRTEKNNIVPVVRMKEYNLNLGVIAANGSKEFTFDMVEWAEPVTSVVSLSNSFTAQMMAQETQGKNIQVRCKVTPKMPPLVCFNSILNYKRAIKLKICGLMAWFKMRRLYPRNRWKSSRQRRQFCRPPNRSLAKIVNNRLRRKTK